MFTHINNKTLLIFPLLLFLLGVLTQRAYASIYISSHVSCVGSVSVEGFGTSTWSNEPSDRLIINGSHIVRLQGGTGVIVTSKVTHGIGTSGSITANPTYYASSPSSFRVITEHQVYRGTSYSFTSYSGTGWWGCGVQQS